MVTVFSPDCGRFQFSLQHGLQVRFSAVAGTTHLDFRVRDENGAVGPHSGREPVEDEDRAAGTAEAVRGGRLVLLENCRHEA